MKVKVKALCIKQPWAWLVVNGHKPIENRTWRTKYRGPLRIVASKEDDDEAGWFHAIRLAHECGVKIPHGLPRGGVVGMVDLVNLIEKSDSPWFFGPFGWVFRNPSELPFHPARGRFGLFDIEERQ